MNAEPEQKQEKDSVWKGVVVIVALGVAVAALAVGVVAVTKKTPKVKLTSVTSATEALHAEAVTLTRELAELKAEVSKVKGEGERVAGSLHTVGTCLPEVMAQINNLSIETEFVTVGENSRRYLTSAYLKNGKQISNYCSKTLEGH